MVEIGKKAPDFKLESDTGETVQLSKLKGKAVVIYFYPKDDTPGCTTEAKDFSAAHEKVSAAGAVVLGISPDSVASHCKFKTKHDLAVTLLADPDKVAAQAYGVWVEKSMYGKTYMGVERSTFLVDRTGKVAAAWSKVKVKGHVDEVMAALADLPG
ncbi:MAG: thioredoxin-dependent thiol peroxidase [Hyphomicrobiaceae bacterium]|nr:thioredoxin-dependent thiol peroxidase [Hyphomicrobiaceae bacterium]